MKPNWGTRIQQALTRRDSGSRAGQSAPAEREGRLLETRELPVGDLVPNPRQPRGPVDAASVRDLADSIAQHGVLQPVLVRPAGSGYELIAGHRRLAAAIVAGLSTIPALVMTLSDDDSGIIALVENLQREDLNFLDEAAAYERLLSEFELTQEDLARRLGKSQSTIANKLRLLRLPAAVRERLGGNVYSERHARALLGLKSERMQLEVCDQIEALGLSVRQAEELVAQLAVAEFGSTSAAPRLREQSWKGVFRDARILSNTFRAAVRRLEESGMEAVMEEREVEEGLEIKVLIKLPAGWRPSETDARRGRA